MTVNYDHPLTYIELDVELTTLKDGVDTCTAGNGWRCFAPTTAANNESIDHQVDAHTYRFHIPSKYHPITRYSIPSVDAVSVTPPSIDIGVSIGMRLSGSVTFSNHPYGDSDIDRHAADRDYNPFDKGTFWGKFTARLPFIRGNKIRILRGFEGQDLSEFTTQHLIVDAYAGNSAGSQFTIKFVDIFRWLDDKQAQAPRASLGRLSADITATDTTVTLVPAGIGDQVNPATGLPEYPASGLGSIGEEEIAFARVGDVFTVTRSEFNTEATEHSADDTLQLTLEYTPQSSADIIYDLIKNYTNIDDAIYINKVAWDIEEAAEIARFYSTRIVKPESVKTLINELVEQVGLMMYQDEIKQEIIYSSVKEVNPSSAIINADVIHAGTFGKKEQDSKMVTQVWTYYNRISAFKKINDEANYDSILNSVGSLTAVPVTLIKKIFSRWIPKNGYDTAARTNSLVLSRYQFPPRKFNFKMYDDHGQHTIGNGYFVDTDRVEDAYGNGSKVPIQITRINRKAAGVDVEAEEMRLVHDPIFGVEGDKNSTITSDTTQLNLLEYHNTFHPPAVSGDTVVFRLEPGIRTGGHVGIDVGIWPAGVNVRLVIYGKALARGGDGGWIVEDFGFGLGSVSAGNGGIAIYARSPITIDNQGVIAGGGGGGGGISWKVIKLLGTGLLQSEGWGAGGAGYPAGIGGPYTLATSNVGEADITGVSESGNDSNGGTGYTINLGGISTPDLRTYGGGGDLAADGEDGIFIPESAGTAFALSVGAGTLFQSGIGPEAVVSPAGIAGVAIDGESFITWDNEGTIIGARIN